MKIPINHAQALGQVVRASRKAQKIRQDDAAGSMGVSENFLGKVEHGSETVQWGKLFQVLEGLGIRVEVDVPDGVAAFLAGAEDKTASNTLDRAARNTLRGGLSTFKTPKGKP